MSDDEAFDIAGSLALKDEDDYSDSSSNEGEDFQDEIIPLDDEKEPSPPPKKKSKPNLQAFPSLNFLTTKATMTTMTMMILRLTVILSTIIQLPKGQSRFICLIWFDQVYIGQYCQKGYKQPTPIQRKTIPLIMEGRDVVGMARTGSGKTAAFVLPLIERLKLRQPGGVRAVILSPSRELALQTYKQVKEFSHGTNLQSIVLIGGILWKKIFRK